MSKSKAIVPLIVVALAMVGGGCAQRPGQAAPPSPPATRPVLMTHSLIGTSVEGRPIEVIRCSDGRVDVLIVAAIHGDEPTSAHVARRLIEALAASPSPGVAVIPCANPDGLVAHRRTNAHGVDLNRNFPAANWKRTHRGVNYGGPQPLSEPESIALQRSIDTLRPKLIVSIHSMQSPCDNYDGPAEGIARLMSQSNGYPVRPNIGYPTPGSLGSWAGVDLSIPIITLELPRAQPGEAAWLANRDALLKAISRGVRS